jgi:ATP-dependent Clp protease ATP-binding subunit ClpA
LKGVRVVEVQLSTLTGGLRGFKDLDQRVRRLIIEASQPGIVLFIADINSIFGQGTDTSAAAVAARFTPDLARGTLSCIVAGTEDEYRRIIESDYAIERWFQPIRVRELSLARTLEVVTCVADYLEQTNGVQTSRSVLQWLGPAMARRLRGRVPAERPLPRQGDRPRRAGERVRGEQGHTPALEPPRATGRRAAHRVPSRPRPEAATRAQRHGRATAVQAG